MLNQSVDAWGASVNAAHDLANTLGDGDYAVVWSDGPDLADSVAGELKRAFAKRGMTLVSDDVGLRVTTATCFYCGHPVPPPGVLLEPEADYDHAGRDRERCVDGCVC